MVDTISAPAEELCVLEGCGRLKAEHTFHGHQFVSRSQLVTSRPRPRDPFRDIRPMTDTDKQRATDVERTFSETRSPAPSRIQEQPQMEKFEDSKPVMRDKRPCAVCGKPRTNHRGGIDHTYEPMGDVAAAAHDKREPEAKPEPQRERHVRHVRRSAPRRTPAKKEWSLVELAQRIDELRTELEQHVGMMKQMLG
jgi:hypothetical protein